MILKKSLRYPFLCGALLLAAGCAGTTHRSTGLNDEMVSRAVNEAVALDASGGRVWCVPFARNASGIEIRGNAETWWDQAAGAYGRGHDPLIGAVMAFSGSSKLPMGHVAVVSGITGDREITVHHANWERNKVSLDMRVIDVSDNNDWTRVRLESVPGAFGGVYPVDGFIFADEGGA
ncbi:MAG: CHAP domain-containing protein [Pseudooceanicola sp.]